MFSLSGRVLFRALLAAVSAALSLVGGFDESMNTAHGEEWFVQSSGECS